MSSGQVTDNRSQTQFSSIEIAKEKKMKYFQFILIGPV